MTIALPKTGDLLGGRYRILSKIGEGGYGYVYKAQQEAMGRLVALKILNPEIAQKPEEVERFRREVFHASGLGHANTIILHDFGESNGLFYIAMEYLEGMNLRDWLLRNGPLDPETAIEVTTQILSSLRQAHERSIIHRDLKPDNIFLCNKAHENVFIKVLDFGLSKYDPTTENFEASITSEGAIFGTPQYMSPEQAYGEPVSKATDIYAMGLILYEMLTGDCAFNGKDAKSILLKQVSKPLPDLPENIRNATIVKFLEIATEKESKSRFADAAVALDWLLEASRVQKKTTPTEIIFEPKAIARPIPKRTSEAHEILRSFEGRVAALPLIGRDQELASLKEWAKLAISTGGFGTIVGDLGFGKSKLLDEFDQHLNRENILVFRGAFQPKGEPLSAFREAFTAIVENNANEGSTLPATLSLTRIRQLFEILSPAVDKTEHEENKLANFVFIEDTISKLSRERPIAILLEDLHFADPLSIELLHHWREELSISRFPILLFSTTRVQAEIPKSYNERGTFSKRMELTPLVEKNAIELMERLLPLNESSMKKIYSQAGGNPLFLIELIRSLSDDSGLSYRSEEGFWNLRSSEIAIPKALDELLVYRAQRLININDEKTGQMLFRFFQYAILFGPKFRTRDIRDLCLELDDNELFSAFDNIVRTLTQSYFLTTTSIQHEPALEFRYDILRRSLQQSPEFRNKNAKKIHAFLARKKIEHFAHFRETGIHASEISDHFLNADLYLESYRWRIRSAHDFEQSQDYRSALQQFRIAEGMLNETIDPTGEKLLEIRLASGVCYQNAGDFGLAEFALRSAYVESQNVGDLVGSAQAGERLANVKVLTSSYQSADDILRSVQELYIRFRDFSGVARCEIGLANISRFRGNYLGAERRFEVTLFAAKERQDHENILTCSIGLARCAYGAGRLKEAIKLFEGARTKAESLGNISRVADIDIDLGLALIRVEGIVRAEEQARLALGVKRKLGDRLGIASAHLTIGMALRRSTRLDEAEFHARRALALSEKLSHLYIVAKSILLLSEIAWVQGDIKLAKEHARESEALHKEIKDYHGLALTKSFLALYACETGAFEKARNLINQSLDISGKRGLGLYHAQFLLLHGLVYEQEANVEEALAHFGEALELAEKNDNHETASFAATCLAKNHIAIGDFSAIKEDVEVARRHADLIGNNINISLTLAAEVVMAKLTEDHENFATSLLQLKELIESQPGLKLPQRIFETGFFPLRFRKSERSAKTANIIAEVLDALNETDLANDLRKRIPE